MPITGVPPARRRAGEHLFPFHDIHYLYALARAGAPGEAEVFLASLEHHAESLTGPARIGGPAATEGFMKVSGNISTVYRGTPAPQAIAR